MRTAKLIRTTRKGISTQCIHGHGQRERRIHPAGQTDDGPWKTILAHVIAHAQHQRAPDLFFLAQWGGALRFEHIGARIERHKAQGWLELRRLPGNSPRRVQGK